MAWQNVLLTLRATNGDTVDATPHHDLSIECYAERPKWKDEEGTESVRDVGGYRGNSIARRREYTFLQRGASVALDTQTEPQDAGHVNVEWNMLYARKLFIMSVANTYRAWRDPATGLPTPEPLFWASSSAPMGIELPREVRRVSFDVGDENGFLEPVLVLEDVWPTVGVPELS